MVVRNRQVVSWPAPAQRGVSSRYLIIGKWPYGDRAFRLGILALQPCCKGAAAAAGRAGLESHGHKPPVALSVYPLLHSHSERAIVASSAAADGAGEYTTDTSPQLLHTAAVLQRRMLARTDGRNASCTARSSCMKAVPRPSAKMV